MRYTLPPVNQIAGFNTMGQPNINPLSGRHLFFQTPEGEPPSVVNAGEAVSVPMRFNPLFYGQTAAYTGPQGPTDRGEMVSALPELPKAVGGGQPQGMFDQMDANLIIQKLAGNTVNRGNMNPLDLSNFLKLNDDGSYSAVPNEYGIFDNIGKLDRDGNEITKDVAMRNFMNLIIDESPS